MRGTFTLSITLGNEAMQTHDDIARALREVAERLERGGCSYGVWDENGNRVGSWQIVQELNDEE